MTSDLQSFALDQYAAATCPVKTQNRFNRLIAPPHPVQTETVPPASTHRDHVFRLIRHYHSGEIRDVRSIPAPSRLAASLSAMADGAPIIIGADLPVDRSGHRRGFADLLLRGDDVNGHPTYHPVVIKDHLVVSPTPPGQGGQLVSSLCRPFLNQAHPGDFRYRIETGSADLLELVHLWYLLGFAGFASPRPYGAIIGTDNDKAFRGHMLVWMNLNSKQIRTFSYTSPHQWKKYSPVNRYCHEHRFRVRMAIHALQQTGSAEDPQLVASPVRTSECALCEWWTTCWNRSTDDISARIERAHLDAREIMALRGLGVSTITDLASADIDALLPAYLPQVAHRNNAETRLRGAAHQGRLLASGHRLERITHGRIDLPSAPVEIDLDIEASVRNRIYLWGFLVTDQRDPHCQPRYHPFYRFTSLTQDQERDLAEEAVTWLKNFIASLGDTPVLVWHYSGYETSAIRRLLRASKSSPPAALTWVKDFATAHFVDLLPVVKANFFGVDGLGLKAVASAGAHFSWRDPDPGGRNSQSWFAEAVRSPDEELRQATRRRILEYNEDDVRATQALRTWMRSLE